MRLILCSLRGVFNTAYCDQSINQPHFLMKNTESRFISFCRGSSEHEASTKIKTEFLLRFQGITSPDFGKRVIVMGRYPCRCVILSHQVRMSPSLPQGATNRPADLDEAVLRRFEKKIYVPLPNKESRLHLFKHLLKHMKHDIKEEEFEELATLTEYYSGSDIVSFCGDAALAPVRELQAANELAKVNSENDIRPLSKRDFTNSLKGTIKLLIPFFFNHKSPS